MASNFALLKLISRASKNSFPMIAIMSVCLFSIALNFFPLCEISTVFVVNAGNSCSGSNDCVKANTYIFDSNMDGKGCMCVCYPGWTGDKCQTPKSIPSVTITELGYVSEYWSVCNYATTYDMAVQTCQTFGNGWDMATAPTEHSVKNITAIANSIHGSSSNQGTIVGGETDDLDTWKWNFGRLKGSTFFIKSPNRQCVNDSYCVWLPGNPDNYHCGGRIAEDQTIIRILPDGSFDDVQKNTINCPQGGFVKFFPSCFACERSPCDLVLDCGGNPNIGEVSGYFPYCTCKCKENWRGEKCDALDCVVHNCVGSHTYKFVATVDKDGCLCVCYPGWTGEWCQTPMSIPSVAITKWGYVSEYWSTCRFTTKYDIQVQTCQIFGAEWDMATAPTEYAVKNITAISNIIYGSSSHQGTIVGGETKDLNTWKWNYGRPAGSTFFIKNPNRQCVNDSYCVWLPGNPDNYHCGGRIAEDQTIIRILPDGSFDDVQRDIINCPQGGFVNFYAPCFACERSPCNVLLDCDPKIANEVTGYYPNCVCKKGPCTIAKDCSLDTTSDVSGIYPNCVCKCKSGYFGSRCENRDCDINKDCNQTYTSNVSGIYPNCVCNCKPGYFGSRCEKRYCDINKDCNPTYTSNVSGIYPNCVCNCKPGYLGSRCEKRDCDINKDCNPTSTSNVSGIYPNCVCKCKLGYKGKRCQIAPTITNTHPNFTYPTISFVTDPFLNPNGSNSLFGDSAHVSSNRVYFLFALCMIAFLCLIVLIGFFAITCYKRQKAKKLQLYQDKSRHDAYKEAFESESDTSLVSLPSKINDPVGKEKNTFSDPLQVSSSSLVQLSPLKSPASLNENRNWNVDAFFKDLIFTDFARTDNEALTSKQSIVTEVVLVESNNYKAANSQEEK